MYKRQEDSGNAEDAGGGRYPGRVRNAPILYGQEFPGTRPGTLRSNRPLSFATSVMPYISAIRELMVREARREAEAKGSILLEVTMSTMNEVEGTVNEFTYATYIGDNVGAAMPSTMYSDILPKVEHTVMTQLALKTTSVCHLFKKLTISHPFSPKPNHHTQPTNPH